MAIGDCAYIITPSDNKPAAPTGQFAERQGAKPPSTSSES